MELESKQDQVWYVLQMSEGRGDSENDSFGGIGIIKMLEACRKKTDFVIVSNSLSKE